ncbi:Rha family transcriptional regulator [Ideonella oryzae]|uniref:Rha family transcriptional regulator n=1 Tax=Ideonella oryzae TaxID=2937441 RepID=A0ABT1BMM3_9BURK|nr:Rha family transcriptional regulator [Ideonella oryzae]MCO5976807.1 Rha family transcriptional regulator [Ideonella oryzae]
MGSREIADLLHCRHDSVKRTVERLTEVEVLVRPPMVDEQLSDTLAQTRALVDEIQTTGIPAVVGSPAPAGLLAAQRSSPRLGR